MYVRDLNGQQIEVTNLDQAIKQTGLFKEYSHEGESFSEFDKKQKAYWADMYEKLVALKERLSTH